MCSLLGRALLLAATAAASVASHSTTDAAATAPWCAAMELYQSARYAEAREALRRLDAGVADRELDFHLGRLALWFDDQDEALQRLERALSSAPDDARLHNAWGDACGLAAQRAAVWLKPVWARRCLAAYRRAVELEPGNPKWRWSLVGFSCVAPRIVGGGIDRARLEVEALAKCDAMEGVLAKVTVLLAEHRSSEAFGCLDQLLRDYPQSALVWYHVGRCAVLSGEQTERGIAAFRRCLSLSPDGGEGRPTLALAYFRLSELLQRSGDAVGAHEARELALRLQPDLRIEKLALRL